MREIKERNMSREPCAADVGDLPGSTVNDVQTSDLEQTSV